jgi:hypothetical protein
MKVQLGDTVKDRITGFQGVVTGRCEYITGCNQVLVVPKIKSDGSFSESVWFDEQRVDILSEPRVTIDNGANPGCDIPAPKR